MTAEPVETPFLRVVSRDATAEEVAALVAVLASLGGGDEPLPPAPEWSAPRRMHRAVPGTGPAPGRGGWRSSGLPH